MCRRCSETEEVREVMGLGTEYWENLVLMAKVAGMYVHPAISNITEQMCSGYPITCKQANVLLRFKAEISLQ